MKKYYSIFAALFFITSPVLAQVSWEVDRNHSEIQFKVKHMVITTVTGRFQDYDIKFTSKKGSDFSNASIETKIKTASIFTDNERRDNHLRSDDFLNAEEYPEIIFVSKSFTETGNNMYKVIGDLTIRDVTKVVELTAEFSGPVKARGKTLIAFHITGEINRFDYNVKFNRALETGGLVASETVKFDFNLELASQTN